MNPRVQPAHGVELTPRRLLGHSLAALLVFGCGGKDRSGPPLHVAGVVYAEYGAQTAVHWHGNAVETLDSADYIDTYGLALAGQDVLVAGCMPSEEFTGLVSPVLWRNGVRRTIPWGGPPENDGSCAYDVAVRGDRVVMVGATTGRDGHTGWLWDTSVGTMNTMTSASYYENEVREVAFDGDDLYAIGTERTDGQPDVRPQARLWKNGVRVELGTADDGSVAYHLAVAQHRAYVSGERSAGQAVQLGYWVDGAWTNLEGARQDGVPYTSHDGLTLFVRGPDVYVAGTVFESDVLSVRVWKNGAPFQQSEPHAGSIYALGLWVSEQGDTYVSGSEGNVPVVWHNGVRSELSLPAGAEMGFAYDLVGETP